MCGILDEVDRGDQSKGVKLLQQRVKYCYNVGLVVRAPNINISGEHWLIYKNELYASISNIKGLGIKQSEIVVRNRPYNSVEDFLEKTKFGKSKFEILLFAGAFDEFGSRQMLYNWYNNIYTKKSKKDEAQLTLDFLFGEEEIEEKNVRHFSKKELKDLFYEYNGFCLKQNVLLKWQKYIAQNKKVKTIGEVKEKKVKYPLMIGKIQGATSFVSKNGKEWTKILFIDDTDQIQMMLSTAKYEGKKGKTLKDGNVVVVPVCVGEDSDMVFLGNEDKNEIKVLEYVE